MDAKLEMKKLVSRKPAFLKRRKSKGGTLSYAALRATGRKVGSLVEGRPYCRLRRDAFWGRGFGYFEEDQGASYECLPLFVRNRSR